MVPMELDALKTVEGNTILTAAIVDYILGIVILSIVISMLVHGGINPIGIELIFAKSSSSYWSRSTSSRLR